MRRLFDAVLFVLAGLAIGYYSVDIAVTRGFSPLIVENGPWRLWVKEASADADPYTRAHFASFGKLGLTRFEAIEFRAETDAAGRPLDSRCVYIVNGTPLTARWWNLTVYSPQHTFIDNRANRHSYNSDEIIRRADGTFEIVLAGTAQPGNWLPTGTGNKFQIVLRLFDPAPVFREVPGQVSLPTLERTSC